MLQPLIGFPATMLLVLCQFHIGRSPLRRLEPRSENEVIHAMDGFIAASMLLRNSNDGAPRHQPASGYAGEKKRRVRRILASGAENTNHIRVNNTLFFLVMAIEHAGQSLPDPFIC